MHRLFPVLRFVVVALGAALCLHVHAAAPSGGESGDVAGQDLRAKHQKMHDTLARSAFGRPLQLDSVETPEGLQGDIHAVIDRPLADVATALATPAHWCEMLLLHINNRRCRVARGADGGEVLTLYVVRRYDQPLDSAFELPFVYRVVQSSAESLKIDLAGAHGPLGTRNYHVTLEAVALEARKTFLHFGYRYEHNLMASMATQAYLATFGSHKIGFTVVGKKEDGTPEFIRGPRGLVERNAMRYFLTLDAYLAGAGASSSAETRERAWFDGIERFPRQLHEVDLDTYLALKREDRQNNGTPR